MVGKAIQKAISGAFGDYIADKVPPDINDLRRMAWFSLMFGPYSAADFEEESPGRPARWPGWESALDKLKTWAEENLPRELYFEEWSGYLSESEPEGWKDEETGEWFDPEPCYTVDAWREFFGVLTPYI